MTQAEVVENSSSGDPSGDGWRLGHRPALDGLRGIAILLVTVTHGWETLLPAAFYGVDVFFVLSGFLITTILVDEIDHTGTVSFRRFFARRALRLMPALTAAAIGVLVLIALAPTAKFPLEHSLERTPLVLLYLTDFSESMFHVSVGALAHTWSLSIEEHFYIVWPAVLLLAMRRGGIELAQRIAIYGAIAVMFVRPSMLLILDGNSIYYSPFFRSDGLLLGCFLALMIREKRVFAALARHSTWLSVIAAVTLLALCVFNTQGSISSAIAYGFAGASLSSAALIAGVVTSPAAIATRILAARPLVLIGKISYAMYLWNYPIAYVVIPHVSGLATPLVYALCLSLTIAAATASWFVVERPFVRMKRRFASV